MYNDRDRDRYTSKSAPSRAPTSAPAVEVHDETSQAYEIPEERARFRASRPTDVRLYALEKTKDDHGQVLSELHSGLGYVRGRIDELVAGLAQDREARIAHELAAANAKVEEAKAKTAIAMVDLEVVKAEQATKATEITARADVAKITATEDTKVRTDAQANRRLVLVALIGLLSVIATAVIGMLK